MSHHVKTFIRQEVQLAKTEISEKIFSFPTFADYAQWKNIHRLAQGVETAP